MAKYLTQMWKRLERPKILVMSFKTVLLPRPWVWPWLGSDSAIPGICIALHQVPVAGISRTLLEERRSRATLWPLKTNPAREALVGHGQEPWDWKASGQMYQVTARTREPGPREGIRPTWGLFRQTPICLWGTKCSLLVYQPSSRKMYHF